MLIDSIYWRIRFRLEIFNGIIPTYTHFLQYMLWIYAELWIKRQRNWLQRNSTRKTTTTFPHLQAAAAHRQTHRHRRPSFHRNPIAHTNCQLLELVTDQKMIHRIVVVEGLRRHLALLLLLSLAVRLMLVRWDLDRLCCRNFESFCVGWRREVIRYDPTQIKCSLQFLSKLIRHFEIEILRLLRLTLRWLNVPVVLIAIIRHFQRISLEFFFHFLLYCVFYVSLTSDEPQTWCWNCWRFTK